MSRHQCVQQAFVASILFTSRIERRRNVIRFDGIEHTYLGTGSSRSGEITQTGRIVFEKFILTPIGLLMADRRREITLPRSFHAVQIQVRTHKVDPHDRMPGGDPHPVLERHIVSADAEQLTQTTPQPILVSDRSRYFGTMHRIVTQPQSIDARLLHMPELLHEGPLVKHIPYGIVLAVVMPRPDQSVRRTIIPHGFAEGLFHTVGQRTVIIEPDLTPVSHRIKQRRQYGSQGIPPLFLEYLLHDRRITDHPFMRISPILRRYLRLVAEDTHRMGLSLETIRIRLETAVDKGLHHLRVHQIDPTGPVVPRLSHGIDPSNVFIAFFFVQHTVRGLDFSLGFDTHQTTGLKIRIHPRHDSPGESAGPFVLIVIPGIHSQLLQGFGTHLHHVEPFVGQIGRQQPDTTMQKSPSVSGFFKDMELSAQFVSIQRIIERVKRNSPESIFRISELGLFETIGIDIGWSPLLRATAPQYPRHSQQQTPTQHVFHTG